MSMEEVKNDKGEVVGAGEHMDSHGMLQEEYGKLSLAVMNAEGDEKEKIEARLKELEAELNPLQEAA
jgi:hypothetical protein